MVDGALGVSGNLAVTGAQTTVQGINGTVAVFNSTTTQDAIVSRLNGPNDRTVVESELALSANVRVSENTSFIGTIRTGGVASAGNVSAVGEVSGQSVTAEGSVVAGANIETGVEGRLRAGLGGIFVRDKQVFDGNGNLLAKPSYACAAGSVMYGTNQDGSAKCASVACDAGKFFRGWDAQMNPVCATDQQGLTALPAVECPDGQAVIGLDANGLARCGVTRAGDQICPENQFVIGFDANARGL